MVTKQMPNYNRKKAEKKWQKFWEEKEIFKFDAKDENKPKHYTLSMFPYPSGEMHVGHLRNFAIGDVIARYKRLCGYNVLHPTGADAFGLPAENAAIKRGLHPSDWTRGNLNRFIDRYKMLGLSFDFSRTVATCEPDYYGWQQKIFIEFYKKGLAFQKEGFVNWDPVDQTVLANEQVIDGKGWRSGAVIEKKELKQWFFKITDYAEELLKDLDKLEGWPEKIRVMQRNWIGKSEGVLIDFKLSDSNEKIKVFTTRHDTLYGASFIGIALDHPIAKKLAEKDPKIAKFVEECSKTSVDEETLETMEKKGIDTGLKVIHPFDEDWKLPVYIANFVLMNYGTGAIFGCPAHDARDFVLATKYKLPIRTVVSPDGLSDFQIGHTPYLEDGIIINSDFLDGLSIEEAKEKSAQKLKELGAGDKQINYRLRDWGISRQRYWGCPIPIVYCPKCGVVTVEDKDLPIKLPRDAKFDGKGNPLDKHPTWKHTKCPKCGGKATRETDTMDTFVDSSWYFLRFVDLANDTPINTELCNKIMPIDQYVGGAEHATMHLIYCRFFTKALRDCGYVDMDEPVTALFNQGMVCHKAYRNKKKEWIYPWDMEEKDGKYYDKKTKEQLTCTGIIKMSKSKRNVVDITDIVEAYGADSARLFVLSDSPADKDFEWTEQGIEGCWKYINRLWKLGASFVEENESVLDKLKSYEITSTNGVLKEIHKTTKYVTQFFEKLEFNKAIAKIRELSNVLERFKSSNDQEKAIMCLGIRTLIKLIAPFTPHVCEELNELFKEEKLHEAKWPEYDEKMTVDDMVTVAVQVNGRLRATIEVPKDLTKSELEEIARKEKNVERFLTEGEVKKVIVVPNRLVNVVVE